MGKRKNTNKSSNKPGTSRGKQAQVRDPSARKKKKKAAPAASKKRRKEVQVVALDKKASTLLPTAQRDSLIAWFNLYMTIEGGEPTSNTFKAKAADLTRFMEYFNETLMSDDPDQWTPGLTKRFVTKMLKTRTQQTKKKLAATTINRVLATLRTSAKWIHHHRAFKAGYPLQKISDIQTSEPDWKGLTDVQVTRMLAAGELLMASNTKTLQTAVRDYAMLQLLLGTALRVSEVVNLDLDQYEGKHLVRVQRKGNNITDKVLVPQDAREAIDYYLDEVRGDEQGELFLSKSGKPLAIQNVADALKRIAKQACAKLSDEDSFTLSPHVLRHTALRKMAEKKGIRFAQKMAGHASSKYIWRYIQPGSEEMEEAVEGLYD